MSAEDDLEELLKSIPDEEDRKRLMEALESSGIGGGLIDRTAMAYLLADEMGIYIPEKQDIGSMKEGGTVDVEGEIARIDPVKHFKRKDGGEGSLISLHIDDGTGRCRLTIFDWKLIEAIEAGEFKEGQRVRVIGVTSQDRGYGLELKFSKGSQIIPLEDDGAGGKDGGIVMDVEGILVSVPEVIRTSVGSRELEMVRVMLYTGENTLTINVPEYLRETLLGMEMEKKLRIGGLKLTSGQLNGVDGECFIEPLDK